MRGKETTVIDFCNVVGITPAYAGKRIFRFASDGEIIGSPPPMRGKGHNSKILETQNRITPAYAGKSLFL